uniref:Uncharacterized protein n=1 Tax=Timema bartmani TaxID=61472 RepID=A0A7R9EQL3_9NEOP|nr:unnamed protein product [Timema bartmani]
MFADSAGAEPCAAPSRLLLTNRGRVLLDSNPVHKRHGTCLAPEYTSGDNPRDVSLEKGEVGDTHGTPDRNWNPDLIVTDSSVNFKKEALDRMTIDTLANAPVMLNHASEDGEIDVRISVG